MCQSQGSHACDLCRPVVLLEASLFQMGQGAGVPPSEDGEPPDTPRGGGQLLSGVCSGAAHTTTHRMSGHVPLHGPRLGEDKEVRKSLACSVDFGSYFRFSFSLSLLNKTAFSLSHI